FLILSRQRSQDMGKALGGRLLLRDPETASNHGADQLRRGRDPDEDVSVLVLDAAQCPGADEDRQCPEQRLPRGCRTMLPMHGVQYRSGGPMATSLRESDGGCRRLQRLGDVLFDGE